MPVSGNLTEYLFEKFNLPRAIIQAAAAEPGDNSLAAGWAQRGWRGLQQPKQLEGVAGGTQALRYPR